jgi:dolichol-phosphate mannosyltransferase
MNADRGAVPAGEPAQCPPPVLSIVIPVYNEEEAIAPLAAEIELTMASAGIPWEVLWVDDGSTDRSVERLRRLGPAHGVLRLDRQHGQTAAVLAGVEHAKGEWIGTLDGDGQNDPADLLRQLLLARTEGFDLVGGVRTPRRDGLVRRLSSIFANRLRRWTIGYASRDSGCATRVVRRAAMLDLPVFFAGLQLYVPDFLVARGWRVTEIAVSHRPRLTGQAKYGIGNRLGSGLCDLLGVRWLLARQRHWRCHRDYTAEERKGGG